MIPRWLYSLLWILATPLIGLRLLWRSRRQPEYRQHLGERFGRYDQVPICAPLIWVHAVSVGETRAAQPLIEGLLARWPGHRILLTGMTPTGRETGRAVYGERVLQAYLPYDYPGATRRFLAHFRPACGVLMETEIWPNLLAACVSRNVPVILANARLSARSARGYGRLPALLRTAFASLAGVCAQTAGDARRIAALGANPVEVCGNIKFDVTPAADKLALGECWRQVVGSRPVWLAASTRDGEEELLLAAWRRVVSSDALLVLVPRHPQRFADVASLLDEQGWSWRRRSEGLPDAGTRVWLGDSMGEMAAYYRLADLAFIGGSLLPLGGQNLIEAAACDCPVLVGPHTFNFLQATEDAIAAGVARRVSDAEALAGTVRELLANAGALSTMRRAAGDFACAHRGAAERTLALIARWSDRAGC
ncbi:MAG: lipid IV(A) 3-deoxy-D-manno-octulosonic acid transferase [Azonexus sp.]|jgi:3-deoxy-D-manno-octulosonic-acid transferase|uniref:lipid IV(A) 3-deoxy-D-manno-octulosonic acid transferase n=1 Tax=Azonexus sp. TaxID=1872668 RepID=UPI002818E52A|nr:lipid IV(A) 3-deoxy-D-manno-octulosonic acid transferase [Azonexus sp.]MDR0776374.1 lipid IV(A) 3-deoxy-D-manno-octulosonic acid transferase [Azonexus sp.]